MKHLSPRFSPLIVRMNICTHMAGGCDCDHMHVHLVMSAYMYTGYTHFIVYLLTRKVLDRERSDLVLFKSRYFIGICVNTC